MPRIGKQEESEIKVFILPASSWAMGWLPPSSESHRIPWPFLGNPHLELSGLQVVRASPGVLYQPLSSPSCPWSFLATLLPVLGLRRHYPCSAPPPRVDASWRTYPDAGEVASEPRKA